MTTHGGPRKRLPARPSIEHLRKQAKRLAKAEAIALAEAQRKLANDYGFTTWKALRDRVTSAPAADLAPLHRAARRGDPDEVRRRLDAGEGADGLDPGGRTALWHACDGEGPTEGRLAVARALLAAGASPRLGEPPLHRAAERGPWAMVELLLRGGAPVWQQDRGGRAALDHARTGSAPDRAEIAHKLDRPVIDDPDFKAAVGAIQAGDVAKLVALLDARPGLLRERAIEPDCYPAGDYFKDPRLFWFVANNPNLAPRLPDNVLEVMAAMIDRGVDRADLDYALELVMTSGPANAQGLAPAMIAALLEAGAEATPRATLMALAHRETAAVEALLARGHRLSAAIAAGLGRTRELPALLASASPPERQEAFAVAAVNGKLEAARLCLEGGADVNGALPVHRHATALHCAVDGDDLDMVRLLVERGARRDVHDALWQGTPLDWARFLGRPRALAYLESLAPS